MSNRADNSIGTRIRAEWQKIRSMQGRERREYIWDYYKFHIIGTIIGVLLVGSIVNDTIINPPPRSALTIAWAAGFEPHYRLDRLTYILNPAIVQESSRNTVQIISFVIGGDPQMSMAIHQQFFAMSAANELDIVVGNISQRDDGLQMLGIAPLMAFRDIRPTLEEVGIFTDANDLLYDNLVFYKGEGYETPIAVAISLDGNSVFDDAGLITENRFLGIMGNSLRDEAVVKAIQVLMAGYYG
ncbi:MAG: hypothetical protein FWC91_12910 [Defluviitaleaceae bacterium]|nr:hypothetical protein [Defluviitaleaceae bacterium]